MSETPHQIVVQAVDDELITLVVNGVSQQIRKELDALRGLLLNQTKSFQRADKIDKANFS